LRSAQTLPWFPSSRDGSGRTELEDIEMQSTTTGPSIIGATEQGAEQIEKLSGNAQETVNRIADATAARVREMGLKGEQMRQQWMETQEQWVGSARECVRSHPIASVAIAVGVGLLLSRLTSRQ
jgi:ElaB/YqjD/DUF883 family membrane-anchored ribosome-binding protein